MFYRSTILLAVMAMTACSGTEQRPADLTNCVGSDGPVRLNEVQSIGSHNSYKLAIPPAELAFIRLQSEAAALSIDYAHVTLTEQLDLGMRQLELDIYHDPEGGRFSDPLLPKLAAANGRGAPFDTSGHEIPGFKVMHIQDIDPRSNCTRFVECLEEINTWSEAHPHHTPILLLINAKQDQLDFPGATEALAYDAAVFDALDSEVLSVFIQDRLIVPDQVRGTAPSLRNGVLEAGWPKLADAQGKILIALDESPSVVALYMRGKPSLQGLPLFVNSIDETADHAAYFTINDPVGEVDRIRKAVADGFLVRTRADADTNEARLNDTTRRDAALESGAQYISTDYYQPRLDLSDYQVSFPADVITRCRP